MDLDSLVFAPNNSLATKIKKLDGYVAQNWTLIEIQFRIQLDLDFSIFTLNNSLGTKFNGTREAKLRIQLKYNWIFFNQALTMYIY